MTKKAQREKFKSMLRQQSLSEQDKVELIELFQNHPSWDKKKGVGLANVSIGRSAYGNNCFFLHRVDGSITDISYIQCISGPMTELAKIKKACRFAVLPEVKRIQATVNFGLDTCPFTGEILTIDNTHIDHYDLKFKDVFAEWVKGMDLKELFKAVNKQKDQEVFFYFTNKLIEKDFIDFHNKNTHLRAISKSANMLLG